MSAAAVGAVEVQIVYRPVKGRRVTVFTSSSPTVLMAVREHLVQEIAAACAEMAKSDPVLAEVMRSETLKVSGVLRLGAERQPSARPLRRIK